MTDTMPAGIRSFEVTEDVAFAGGQDFGAGPYRRIAGIARGALDPADPRNAVIANLDIAPWLLGVAGLEAPEWMEGRDLEPLLDGKDVAWRDWLLYEYYWERNFPQTPTVHAIREDRYKYVHFHGVWDIDELYDLQEDPLEAHNLIFSPGHEGIVDRLNAKLFDALEATGGLQIPLPRDAGTRAFLRSEDAGEMARFPDGWLKRLAR